jgi:hypothetical protein
MIAFAHEEVECGNFTFVYINFMSQQQAVDLKTGYGSTSQLLMIFDEKKDFTQILSQIWVPKVIHIQCVSTQTTSTGF